AVTFTAETADDASSGEDGLVNIADLIVDPEAEDSDDNGEDGEEGSEEEADDSEDNVFRTEAAVIHIGDASPEGAITYNGETVDDGVAVAGDTLTFSRDLDATFSDEGEGLAYQVDTFGLVDDYDESVVSVDPG